MTRIFVDGRAESSTLANISPGSVLCVPFFCHSLGAIAAGWPGGYNDLTDSVAQLAEQGTFNPKVLGSIPNGVIKKGAPVWARPLHR